MQGLEGTTGRRTTGPHVLGFVAPSSVVLSSRRFAVVPETRASRPWLGQTHFVVGFFVVQNPGLGSAFVLIWRFLQAHPTKIRVNPTESDPKTFCAMHQSSHPPSSSPPPPSGPVPPSQTKSALSISRHHAPALRSLGEGGSRITLPCISSSFAVHAPSLRPLHCNTQESRRFAKISCAFAKAVFFSMLHLPSSILFGCGFAALCLCVYPVIPALRFLLSAFQISALRSGPNWYMLEGTQILCPPR